MADKINPQEFAEKLSVLGIDFYTGVPDSLLKNLGLYFNDTQDAEHHIIAANEGNAVAIACGYHLATSKIGLVYMQNSGIGNCVNPLLSLSDPLVYDIPMLLVVGWRGEPGVKDEPQHVKQGLVTLELLEAMKIPYLVLDGSSVDPEIETIKKHFESNNSPFAVVVKKGTFAEYKTETKDQQKFTMEREQAIQDIIEELKGPEIVISTTGKISREVFEIREAKKQSHKKDFLTVGSMGHASQIALGIATVKRDRKVVILDGDGAFLMHTGGISTIGKLQLENIVHIVLNNEAHESVGGQATAADITDFPAIAKAFSYAFADSVSDSSKLKSAVQKALSQKGPVFLEVKVKKGSRSDLGRPTVSPQENKKAFMEFVQSNE